MKRKKANVQNILQDVSINNFVAKHASTFCKAVTHADRKQLSKRGYTKHRGKCYDS